jgi:hypothetical protein
MKRRLSVAAAGISLLAVTASAFAMGHQWFSVRAGEFDPLRTHLVAGTWVDGIGCPTQARTAAFVVDEVVGGAPYTDSACPTGDRDKRVRGLLLAKTGPTSNVAAAVAEIKRVQGKTLTELGYDIRKPGGSSDSRGSHCGAGAPRFNIETVDGGFYFLGCNSPAADATVGDGWIRLRWGGSSPLKAFSASSGALVDIKGKTLKSVTIVFDEGQDAGPDNFGLAVLDNIDVNGRLVGTGR